MAIQGIGGVGGVRMAQVAGAGAQPTGAGGFGEMLQKAIGEVNGNVNEANTSAEGLVTGKHANIDETMIAMEKANISFHLLTKLQNKAIDAYRELSRIQL